MCREGGSRKTQARERRIEAKGGEGKERETGFSFIFIGLDTQKAGLRAAPQIIVVLTTAMAGWSRTPEITAMALTHPVPFVVVCIQLCSLSSKNLLNIE